MSKKQDRLGDRIISHARAKGWSMAEVARRAPMDSSLLSRLVRGEREWRIDQVAAVARALGVSTKSLLEGTDHEHLGTAAGDSKRDAADLSARMAEALTRIRALEAENHSLNGQLVGRPTRDDLDETRERLQAASSELITVRRVAARVKAENAEWQRRAIVAEAQSTVVRNELTEITTIAENYRRIALAWEKEAKRRGSVAALGAVAAVAFGFAALNKSGSTKRARRPT